MMEFIQNTLLFFHVILGAIAVFSGTLALVFKKGKSKHVFWGTTFVWSMIVSSVLGAFIGISQYSDFLITAFAGVLSVTLISSSLLTLKSKAIRYELFFAFLNTANFIAIILVGVLALKMSDGRLFGFYTEDYFFLSTIALVCLIGDIQTFTKKNLAYPHKISRHLWRMCLGFFIAAGSAFTGPGMNAFPKSVQQSGLLSLPELIIALIIVYWMLRILVFNKTKSI